MLQYHILQCTAKGKGDTSDNVLCSGVFVNPHFGMDLPEPVNR